MAAAGWIYPGKKFGKVKKVNKSKKKFKKVRSSKKV
jgi:hypothetical protein